MAAEGFEAYHVPQQSRRDRLREGVSDFSSFYNNDLTSIPSDLILLSHNTNKQNSLHLMDPQEINPFLYNTNHQSSFDLVEQPHVITYNDNNRQGLSLSLSSSHHHRSSTVPLQLNESSLFTTAAAASCTSIILGPFTGYASILKGSRFLKPAQQLMEQICDEVLLEADDSVPLMDPSTDAPIHDDGSEHKRNNSKLISMLDEVYRRYKQYYQHLQGVVASFESVPGLGNAAPFANLSLKALSKHFRCLKNAISDQMNYTIKSHNSHSHSSQINCDDSTTTRSVGKGNLNYNNFQRSATTHNAGFVEHHQPVWRPQRGLPERAVTVLRAWLFDHFLHPYPTDSDKVMLAKQTGLSRNQVSNWFINARVRLWKPMVEEIHMLETRQAHKSASQRQGQNNNNNNNPIEHFPSDQNPSTSKRTRSNDVAAAADQMNISYDNFSPRSRVDQVMSASSGGNGGVSLTLGLHHQNNNGVGIGGLSSEPFPRNAARRFGIDANNEGFVFGGGFEPQNRQFGRDHHNNIIGGQLLHDFVG